MFTLVVIAVAVGVFTMHFRHDRRMRRKRAELAADEYKDRPQSPPPGSKPS